MFRSVVIQVKHIILIVMLLSIDPSDLHAEGQKDAATAQKGLQQRIDFGNAHILGQSIKSGAVYLMHRKKSDIKNMLEVRQHYRNEIREEYDLDKTAIVQSTAEPRKDAKQ